MGQVDWEELELVEYPFIITQPMDLGTVESKLMCGTYVSAAQVERDLRLVFDNAMHFNAPEDPVHQQASKMSKLLSSLWAQAKLATDASSGAAPGGLGAASRGLGGGAKAKAKLPRLYNKVVAIEGGPPGYYFVLHYIPDMQWCHLAEMSQFGLFPKTYKNGKPHAFADRPQWKLLPEGQGAELDVSADRCRVVKCVTVNRVSDADKEAWDILEDPEAAGPARKDAKGAGGAGAGGAGGHKHSAAGASPSKKQAAPGSARGAAPAAAAASAKGVADAADAADAGGAGAAPSQSGLAWNKGMDKEAETLLAKLRRNAKAWPFLDPVDPVTDECPDYFEIIHTPCDLKTVGDRLAAHKYTTAEALLFDLLLTFDNAQVYNPEENQIHKMGADMSAVLRTASSSSPYFGPALPAALEDLKRFKAQHPAAARADGAQEGAQGGAALGCQTQADETPEFKALQAALAQAVAAPKRTCVGKVNKGALGKMQASLTGKLLKIDCNLSADDVAAVVQALRCNLSTERLD
jgi:hypothetical protein